MISFIQSTIRNNFSFVSSSASEKAQILLYLQKLMNNTEHDNRALSEKVLCEQNLNTIFAEIKSNYNYWHNITAYDFSDILSSNFSLDNFSSFAIFNDIILRNLNIINEFIIKPAYTTINNSLISNMGDIIFLYSLIFIGAFAVFLASVLLFYILDWIPFQNHLDSTVSENKLLFFHKT